MVKTNKITYLRKILFAFFILLIIFSIFEIYLSKHSKLTAATNNPCPSGSTYCWLTPDTLADSNGVVYTGTWENIYDQDSQNLGSHTARTYYQPHDSSGETCKASDQPAAVKTGPTLLVFWDGGADDPGGSGNKLPREVKFGDVVKTGGLDGDLPKCVMGGSAKTVNPANPSNAAAPGIWTSTGSIYVYSYRVNNGNDGGFHEWLQVQRITIPESSLLPKNKNGLRFFQFPPEYGVWETDAGNYPNTIATTSGEPKEGSVIGGWRLGKDDGDDPKINYETTNWEQWTSIANNPGDNETNPNFKPIIPSSTTELISDLTGGTITNPGDGSGGGGGGGGAADITCEVILLNPLTWLICPIIEGAQKAVEQFDNAISSLLFIGTDDKSQYTDRNTAAATAWSSMRYIAFGVLLIIALIMIVSQAIGSGPFDAYTIKKIFPRLVASVILIALSWELCILAINISNELGVGIRGIILAPFSALHDVKISTGTSTLAFLGGGVIGLGLGLIGVATFVVTALMAVAVAFVTLVFREMLVLFLVIMAPVAIVCSILPNTQGVWKKWWDFFLKALMAFPIIVGMISIGQAFSRVAFAQTEGLLGQMIGFIAYFGPYFMIPKAFQWAGGAIGAVSGGLGKFSGGINARLGKFRGARTAENWQNIRAGERFSRRNKFTRGMSRSLGRVSSGPIGWMPGRSDIMNEQKLRAAGAAMDRIKQQNNPDVLKALTFNNHAEALEWAGEDEDKINAANIARGIGYNTSTGTAAATKMAQMGLGFKDYDDMQSTANRLAGGDASRVTSMMGDWQYLSKGAGRFDLRKDGNTIKGSETADIRQILGQQAPSMTKYVEDNVAQLKTAHAAGNHEQVLRSLANIQELKNGYSLMTPESQDAASKALAAAQNDLNVNYLESIPGGAEQLQKITRTPPVQEFVNPSATSED